VLAGGVGGAHRHAGGGEERADVDDHAAAGGEHVAGGGLGAQERPGEVDRERARPDLGRELLRGPDRADAGVVDEDVEAAVLGDRRVEQRRHLPGVADVGHPPAWPARPAARRPSAVAPARSGSRSATTTAAPLGRQLVGESPRRGRALLR
jgi:hypothetical protein